MHLLARCNLQSALQQDQGASGSEAQEQDDEDEDEDSAAGGVQADEAGSAVREPGSGNDEAEAGDEQEDPHRAEEERRYPRRGEGGPLVDETEQRAIDEIQYFYWVVACVSLPAQHQDPVHLQHLASMSE